MSNKETLLVDVPQVGGNGLLDDMNDFGSDMNFDNLEASMPQVGGDALLDDLDDMGDLDFSTFGEEEEPETEEPYQVTQFVYNVQELLPEFDTYFKNNKNIIMEKLFDKASISQMKEEADAVKMSGDKVVFKNDDDVIETLFGWLSLDVLSKRITSMQELYRQKIIEFYNQIEDAPKTLDLPILSISQSNPSKKIEISDKPKQFMELLKQEELDDKFKEVIQKADWSQMTKGSFDKMASILKKSKDEDQINFYKELVKREMVIEGDTPPPTYKLSSKIEE